MVRASVSEMARVQLMDKVKRISGTREKHPLYMYVQYADSRPFYRTGEAIGRDSVGF
jgi:hypothetical protein